MAPRRTTVAPAPAKPLSQAARYVQQQQQEDLTRLGVLAGLVALLLLPRLPSPVAGVDWRAPLWELAAPILLMPLPDDPTLPAWVTAPVLVWLQRALAGAGVWFILRLIAHLRALSTQRTAPLAQERTYLSLATPLSMSLKGEDGVGLLRTIHGVLPPLNPAIGGAPLVLRWTGMPEQPIKQGVSVLGPPDLVVSLQKTLEGLGKGTEADIAPDPVLRALGPRRYVCWADVRLQAPDDLPIAIPGGGASPLLDALLPALSPQAGVVLGDVQIMLQPLPDRSWRTAVLARLESLKVDAGTTERRVMEQKAAGPAFRVTLRLLAIAETAAAGAQMVKTMGNALASSAQGIASAQQRLVAGPVQVLPAVLPAAPPLPRAQRLAGLIAGGALAAAGLALVIAGDLAAAGPQVWLAPACLLPLPLLALLAWHRARTRADAPLTLLAVLRSVPTPVNPQVIPVWAKWFGHNG